MIILDTHIWVWWVTASNRLTQRQLSTINQSQQLGISAISCWEVAKLVELQRLTLTVDVLTWLNTALSYPKLHFIPLSLEIIVESTQLPGIFHKDPADQLIVATARKYNCPLLTEDSKIINYPFVLKS